MFLRRLPSPRLPSLSFSTRHVRFQQAHSTPSSQSTYISQPPTFPTRSPSDISPKKPKASPKEPVSNTYTPTAQQIIATYANLSPKIKLRMSLGLFTFALIGVVMTYKFEEWWPVERAEATPPQEQEPVPVAVPAVKSPAAVAASKSSPPEPIDQHKAAATVGRIKSRVDLLWEQEEAEERKRTATTK